MKIEKLSIDNFKSLNDFTLEKPNPFSVFVGANGVGKSNIFEALEYFNYSIPNQLNLKASYRSSEIDGLFGGYKNFVNYNGYKRYLKIEIKTVNNNFNFLKLPYETDLNYNDSLEESIVGEHSFENKTFAREEFKQVIENFSRIFIKASDKKKLNSISDIKLSLDCSNLEQVLKRLLLDANIQDEIKDWLNLFVPAFKDIEIKSDDLSGTDTLLFYEKDTERPFTKNLISDGTFNILCLLVAVYQSETPQFICIEEPEIGLNPFVVKELVTFFREQCREKGHYIWLNTHSQTLVNSLKPEEIIVVNKVDGNTVAKQFIGKDMHGMAMDTAWLSNFFGGGVPW